MPPAPLSCSAIYILSNCVRGGHGQLSIALGETVLHFACTVNFKQPSRRNNVLFHLNISSREAESLLSIPLSPHHSASSRSAINVLEFDALLFFQSNQLQNHQLGVSASLGKSL